MSNDSKKLKEALRRVRAKLRITKVVATRAVKHRNGDSFVGFSGAFVDSVQEDGGRGLEDVMEPTGSEGVSLMDAQLASLILGMHADIAAHQNALGGGAITKEFYRGQLMAIRANYAALIQELMAVAGGEDE